jgi:hypothetical protein
MFLILIQSLLVLMYRTRYMLVVRGYIVTQSTKFSGELPPRWLVIVPCLAKSQEKSDISALRECFLGCSAVFG